MDFKLRLFSCLVTLSLAKCNQFYFPDNMPKAPLLNTSQPIVPDFTAIKGSPEYETVIDSIISEGIAKTTLAINRVILETSRSNYDNIVFAPVSISGKIFIVLIYTRDLSEPFISNFFFYYKYLITLYRVCVYILYLLILHLFIIRLCLLLKTNIQLNKIGN